MKIRDPSNLSPENFTWFSMLQATAWVAARFLLESWDLNPMVKKMIPTGVLKADLLV